MATQVLGLSHGVGISCIYWASNTSQHIGLARWWSVCRQQVWNRIHLLLEQTIITSPSPKVHRRESRESQNVVPVCP